MNDISEPQPEILYNVNICGKITAIYAPDIVEAATRVIEQYLQKQENFDIGTVIQITNIETKEEHLILSEIILANAGLYKEAVKLQNINSKKKKN